MDEQGAMPLPVRSPSPWPPRIALVFGVLAIAGALWAGVELASARAEHAGLEQELGRLDRARAPELRARMDALRTAQQAIGRWQRRRLGLWLTAAVLLLGGFWAMGLRRLHTKMVWTTVDSEPEGPD